MYNGKLSIVIFTVIISFSFAGSAVCSDWPMWRYDSSRSASSPGELPAELYLAWVRQYTPRTMVWDDPLNHDIMPYDRIFEPVVSGKIMIFSFNDSDKVVAINCETGREKWAFYTDGPVRFSPVIYRDKVYFTSDDGYLYCVAVSNGKLMWKFRGGPNGRKILGNKRLISTWPARGGPVIEDGIVYFAASIWPVMGTFIYALDAETGNVIWMNDRNGSRWMRQPHNAPSFAGVAPQGALVIEGDKLLVPGGRSVPACFDKKTGDFLYYQLAGSGKTGGSFVCSGGDVFFNHHRERITTMYHLETGLPLLPRTGRYPILDGTMCYFSGKTVTAYDIGWASNCFERWAKENPEKSLDGRTILTRAAEEMKDSMRWELEVDASGDLIKAGNRLYAAGGQTITALNLPRSGEKPSIAWTKAVDGSVERLLAANDMLFAVTLDGRIMAFGKKKKSPGKFMDRPLTAESSVNMTRETLAITGETGVSEGYALFYGIGDGDLLEALATNTNLHIIAVDPDEKVVGKMRIRFDRAGLYGKRVAVIEGDPFTLDAPPYMASLTVVHKLDSNKCPPGEDMLERIYYSMRPYGGKAVFMSGVKDRAALSKLAADAGLHGLTIVKSGKFLTVSREGPLKGAASWTHNYGNIANTSKSDDSLVRLPLGILWFGGNSNLDVLPRHGHGPAEQVIGGRLFIEGLNSISARDVYTGRVIWKAPLLDLETYGIYYDKTYKDAPTDTRYNQVHIPGANIRGTNFIAAIDRVYVIQGGSCHVLDAETGETVKVISLPPKNPEAQRPVTPPWGYIGVYDDLLIGGSDFVAFSDLVQKKKDEYSIWEDFDSSASKKLIVMDRYSGKILWQIESRFGFLHNGTAAGKGMLYCLDKLPPDIENQLKRRGKPVPGGYRLKAVDIRTGDVVWEDTEHVFGSFLAYSEEHDILLESTRPSRDTVRGETGERMIAFRGSDGALLWEKTINYPTFPILHGGKILTEGNVYSLFTGEPVTRTNPLTGSKTAWSWNRQYGCNYPIACENLITFRSGAAGFYDIAHGGGTGNIGGFKSGCTSSLVAADGVLNAPDYTRTCQCAYQNQTSLALIHMPENESWTYNTIEMDGSPLRRFGLNFGAPGDRLDDNGTLWLDYPSVGGQSPEIPVTTLPEKPEWYLRHRSFINGGHSWVSASGVAGIRSLSIDIAENSAGKRPFTVRLYFAEPDKLKPGERVFNVTIQGQRALDNFDIAAESGKRRKTIVREFKNIQIGNKLTVTFDPAGSTMNAAPLISGIEVIAE